MKKEKYILWVRLLTVVTLLAGVVSCSNEMTVGLESEGKPIVVVAEIGGQGAAGGITRTDAVPTENTYDRTEFVSTDVIRITKTVSGKSESADYVFNDSKWSAKSNALKLQSGATYQAVYPVGYENGQIRQDQTSAENYWLSNRLLSGVLTSPRTENLGFTVENNTAFKHQNARLTVIFKPERAVTAETVATLLVSAVGLRTGNNDTQSIKPLYVNGLSTSGGSTTNATTDLTWCCIMYPKGGETGNAGTGETDITVRLTYEEVVYTVVLKSKMKAGTDYRYTLSLHNDILIPEDITIKDWENGGNKEGNLKDITT